MIGTMLIVEASRGIGAAMAEHYEGRVASLVTASRSPAPRGRWIGCDVADPQQIERLARGIGDGPLDALLVPGGAWERGAFTVVNPGNVATPDVPDDIAAGRFGDQVPIPMTDLAAATDCALAMSPASTIAEINIAQRRSGT